MMYGLLIVQKTRGTIHPVIPALIAISKVCAAAILARIDFDFSYIHLIHLLNTLSDYYGYMITYSKVFFN